MIQEIITRLAEKTNHLGQYTPDNPEWHELRKNRIGGSEVGAIAGESRYESAYSLWAKKLGLIPENAVDNSAMYWGRTLEPVIIAEFAKRHPEFQVVENAGTFVDRTYDFMLANPDALYVKDNGDIGVLEIKTARYADDWADGLPRYYMTQVQWYLNVLGLSEAYLAVLFSGSDYQEYYVAADKQWQDHDFLMVRDFVKCLEEQTKPWWDGSESTVSAVRQQHPDIEPKSSVELGDLGMYYVLALEDLETAKSRANELQAQVLDAMGSAREGLVHDIPCFIRTSRNGGTPYLTRKRK